MVARRAAWAEWTCKRRELNRQDEVHKLDSYGGARRARAALSPESRGPDPQSAQNLNPASAGFFLAPDYENSPRI